MEIQQPTDIDIDPTIAIGGTITGGTAGSVLFVNPNNVIAQDNPNFTYNSGTKIMSLGGDINFLSGGGRSIRVNSPSTIDTVGTGLDIRAATGNGDGSGGPMNIAGGDYGNNFVVGGLGANLFIGGGTSTAGGGLQLTAGGTANGNTGGNIVVNPANVHDGGSILLNPGINDGLGSDGLVSIGNPTTGFQAFFDTSLFISSSRTFSFPDKSGTFALTSDITSSTLAAVSTSSTTTPNSLYTMTSTIPVEFKTSGGGHLLYLDETNGRVGFNTATPATLLDVNGVTTLRGNLLFGTDNTYNIGATGGANRPSTIYVANGLNIGNSTAIIGPSEWTLPSTGDIRFNGIGKLFNSSGTFKFRNDANSADASITAGGAIFSSSVAINTVSPGAKLEVAEPTAIPVQILRNTNTGAVYTTLQFKSGYSGIANVNQIVGNINFGPDAATGGRMAIDVSDTSGNIFNALLLDSSGNLKMNPSNLSSGGNIIMSNASPSAIGIVDPGSGQFAPWLAYCATSSQWFTNAAAGDNAYRNTAGRLLFGNGIVNPGMFLSGDKLAVGLSALGNPTALLHLGAGTTAATTAPLKFTSGSLMTAPEVGAVEYLTDKWYGTITTGAARKEFTINDSVLTSGKIPVATTNGRLQDSTASTLISAGVSTVVASTFEKAETGSDANILTYTTGGTDEYLNVMVSADVSALTGTSVVITATWKDSNNATATSSITLSGVTDGSINVPINAKTATNVVVSAVFVGVSTAYNVSAFVTRYK